jgi:predicted RNase H-like HicB family nuclease
MAKEKYTASDGKLLLTLTPMKEGGFMVRSPMDPEILTSARTLGEAFTKAHDVRKALIASRRKAQRQRQRAAG